MCAVPLVLDRIYKGLQVSLNIIYKGLVSLEYILYMGAQVSLDIIYKGLFYIYIFLYK